MLVHLDACWHCCDGLHHLLKWCCAMFPLTYETPSGDPGAIRTHDLQIRKIYLGLHCVAAVCEISIKTISILPRFDTLCWVKLEKVTKVTTDAHNPLIIQSSYLYVGLPRK